MFTPGEKIEIYHNSISFEFSTNSHKSIVYNINSLSDFIYAYLDKNKIKYDFKKIELRFNTYLSQILLRTFDQNSGEKYFIGDCLIYDNENKKIYLKNSNLHQVNRIDIEFFNLCSLLSNSSNLSHVFLEKEIDNDDINKYIINLRKNQYMESTAILLKISTNIIENFENGDFLSFIAKNYKQKNPEESILIKSYNIYKNIKKVDYSKIDNSTIKNLYIIDHIIYSRVL